MTANGQLADNKYLLNSNSSIGSIAFTSTAAGAHTFNIDNVQIYTPAGLAINGPNPVFIPAADSSTFLYSSAYTSDTGTVDNSPSVTWTTIPAEIDGVSIDANGMLSVDSTALPGSFTVQAVLASDSSVISSKTVTLSASSDATTNYMAFSYSKTNPSSNIPISVTPNGNTLVSVLYGGTTLDPVTDYTFENNKLTLSPDYLNSFPSGSYINLKLHMSGGADPTLIVSVIDPNEQPQTATISNASALVDTLAKQITLTGSISSGSGIDVTARGINPAGKLEYTNQAATTTSTGELSFSYQPASITSGKYSFGIGGAQTNTAVTVQVYVPSIDWSGMRLTGLSPNQDYDSVSGSVYSSVYQSVYNGNLHTDALGNLPIPAIWFGQTETLTHVADPIIGSSAAVTMTIPSRAPAPAVSSENETLAGYNDGKIIHTSAGMEYSADNGATWISITGSEVAHLASGTYLVRISAVTAAGSEAFPSQEAAVNVLAGAGISRILNIAAPSFSPVTEGYTRPGAQVITMSNSGNSSLTLADVAVDNITAFDITGSEKTLSAGVQITSYTIQPKAGLAAGTYYGTIQAAYNGSGATSASAVVVFTVNPPVAAAVYQVNLVQVAGGTAAVSSNSAEAGTQITLTAAADPGFVFTGWSLTPSVTWTTGGAAASTATFIMPDTDLTVTPVFTSTSTPPVNEGGGNGGAGDSDSGDNDNDGNVPESASGAPASSDPNAAPAVNDAPGNTEPVTIQVTDYDGKSDIVIESQTGDQAAWSVSLSDINSLSKSNSSGTLTFVTPSVRYDMPFNILSNITGLAEFASRNQLSLDNLTLDLKIEALSGDQLAEAEQAFKEAYPDSRMVSSPVSLTLEIRGTDLDQVDFAPAWFDDAVSFQLQTASRANAILYFHDDGHFEFVPATAFTDTSAVGFTRHHSTYAAVYNEAHFSDVSDESWYAAAVAKAANKALVSGVGSNLYEPERSVTRAEFVQMMVNALQLPPAKSDTQGYGDVSSTQFYYETIMKARSAGLLSGFEGESFSPNQPITREEMASILSAAAHLRTATASDNVSRLSSEFADFNDMNKSYLDAIQNVYQLHLMIGTSDRIFAPQGLVTRAQAATALINMTRSFGLTD